MKNFLITEEEKSRILNMHKSAIAKQYLGEQGTPTPATTTQTTQPAQPTVAGQKEHNKLRGLGVNFASHAGDSDKIIIKIPHNNNFKMNGGDHNFSCSDLKYYQKDLTPGDIKQVTTDATAQAELTNSVRYFCNKIKQLNK